MLNPFSHYRGGNNVYNFGDGARLCARAYCNGLDRVRSFLKCVGPGQQWRPESAQPSLK